MRDHEKFELYGTFHEFLRQMKSKKFKDDVEMRLKEFIDVDDEGHIVDLDVRYVSRVDLMLLTHDQT